MPVPKRKTSKSKRNMRSSTKGMKVKSVAVCQTCSAPVVSHSVCKGCGYYKGEKVLRTKSDRLHERTQSRQAERARLEAMQTKTSVDEEKKSEK
ncbi:MAG: 50S ribosomal protein L32 [bacterium]